MLLSLPDRDQRQDRWQQFAALLISAAEVDNPSLTAIATHRIEEALRRPLFTAVRLADDTQNKSRQRFPIIRRKTFPDVNGTWGSILVSTWIDPNTGKTISPINATVWISQTLFSISIKLKIGESTSYSTRYFLEAAPSAARFRV